MAPRHIHKQAGWIHWARLAGIAVVVALFAGYAGYFHELWRYSTRSSAAHDNTQFIAAWNMRRSGDIITVSGTVSSTDPSVRRAPGQYAWVELGGIGKTVALAGVIAPFCDGDDIAVSGTYRYDSSGGVILVTDPQNVATDFHGYASKLDRAIRGYNPSWCGFPGMPVNPAK